MRDLLSGRATPMQSGCLDVELGPHEALLCRPADDHPSGYRFYK
jgi:hypothetical protein